MSAWLRPLAGGYRRERAGAAAARGRCGGYPERNRCYPLGAALVGVCTGASLWGPWSSSLFLWDVTSSFVCYRQRLAKTQRVGWLVFNSFEYRERRATKKRCSPSKARGLSQVTCRTKPQAAISHLPSISTSGEDGRAQYML